ncbi:FtsX-like permease family protein [Arcanobacterium hippocoleae]
MPIIPCTGEYLATDCTQLSSPNEVRKETQNSQDNGVIAINYGAPYDFGVSVITGKDRADIAAKLTADSAMDPSLTEDLRTFIILKIDSLQTLEKLRNTLAAKHLDTPNLELYPSVKYSGEFTSVNPPIETLTKITYFGIIATVLIATISLLVSTYASILERRRTLLTLRLSGMSLHEIYRMILVESLAPLLAISLFSTLIGMGAGWIFMQLLSVTLDASISPIFITVLIGSMLASALAIRTILPTIKKAAALSANRQE